MQNSLIARGPELAAVERLLTRATTELAGLVMEGEPGIGKTTLWEAALATAPGRGYHVLSAQPARSESKLPLGVYGDLFSTVAPSAIQQLPSPQRDAFEVAMLRADPRGLGAGQRGLSVATTTLLRAISQTTPVVIAIDDAQWLDRSSAALLSYALRRVPDVPIGVLIFRRSGDAAQPPLGVDVAIPPGRFERLSLGPFSLAALHQLLVAHTGKAFSRLTLVKIEAISGGNPFYALEIARSLIKSGVQVKPGERLPIPEALSALTGERIAALPARTRDALLIAAVALDTSIDELARVAGTSIAQDLDPAVREGVVALEGGNVRFSHPLLASAVLARANAARIQEIQAALALTVRSDETRARHMGLATEGSDGAAAEALEATAEHARLRGAPVVAAEMLERARELTPPDRGDDAVNRAYLAARCYAEAGEWHEAGALLEKMVRTLPRGSARGRVLQLLGQVRAWSASFPEALALALEALEEAGDDIPLKADIELDVVFCSLSLGDLPGAEAHARAATALGESVGSPGLQASALAILSTIEFFMGQGVSDERMGRALEMEDPFRPGPTQIRPRFINGLLLLFTGRLDEARASLVEFVVDAAERGQEAAIPMLSFYVVWACIWAGDVAEAGRVARQARDVAMLNDDASMRAMALSASALAAAHSGASDRAHADAGDALALMQRIQWTLGTVWPLWALGFLETSLDHPARVDALLRPLADTITQLGDVDPILGVFLPDEIEALAALGDLDTAHRYVAWLERNARRLDRASALRAAARCRGMIAAAGGDLQSALGALETAVAEYQRAGMPLELARTLLVKGQVHRRNREKRLADEALREGGRIFHDAGAPVWE